MSPWSMILLAVLPATTGAAALAPLADRVPASAIAYVGWAGTEALQPAYDKSHLKAVLDDTNFVEVLEQQWPRLQDMMQRGHDAAHDEQAEHALAIASRHPLCVFADAVDVQGKPMPQPRLGMLVDAGDDAVELMKAYDGLKHKADDDIQVGSLNHVVWFVGGSKIPFEPEHGGTASLGESNRFAAVQKHLDFTSTPGLSIYVDLQRCLTLANRAADQDEQGKKFWPGVRDALGFTNLQAVGGELGFNGPNWAMEAFVAAPAPRTGLLAVVEPKPIAPALLAHVPTDADDVSATNFDVAGFFDTVKAAISVNPAAADGFGKVMGAANLFVGRNIRRQLIAPLGPQWAAAFSSGDPKKVELFNLVNDAKTLQDSLTSATYALSNTLNIKLPAKADSSPGAVANQTKISGVTVTSIALAMASPAWAIHDSILAVTADPDVTAKAFEGDPGAGQKALDEAKQQCSAKADLGAFSYADLPHSAPLMYDRLASVGESLLKLKDQYKIRVPDLRFPTLDELKPELTPAASVEWAGDDGWTFRSVSPFPGSSLLAASQGGSIFTSGAAATATGILLPSLNRARETADRVKSARNEHQLGLAMLMYATDHKGQYPDALGDLVAQGVEPQTFVNPSSDTSVPDDLDTPVKKSAWIDHHSDYVYLGKGLTSSATPDTVVLYENEKPDAGEPHGMNVLYGDGHAEYVDATQAMEIRQKHPAP